MCCSFRNFLLPLLLAKVREFSAEVLKKVEKRVDEVLKLEDTEKPLKVEKGKKKNKIDKELKEYVRLIYTSDQWKELGIVMFGLYAMFILHRR